MRHLGTLLLATAARGVSVRDQFAGFKLRYGKVYEDKAEEARRFATFRDSLRRAEGDPTLGVTELSDISDEEFRVRYLGRTAPTPRAAPPPQWDGTCYVKGRFPELCSGAAPAAFDWSEKGAVTAVRTQHCGDCYAFSSAADIEGSWFLAGNPLTPLSVEQIVDCCFDDMGILDCAGCAGGNQEYVFDWLVEKGGVDSDKTYPYNVAPKKGHPSDCKRDLLTNSSYTAHISGWYQVSGGMDPYGKNGTKHKVDEAGIMEALVKTGPLSLGIAAADAQMKQYKGGVAAPKGCNKDSTLDHAVLFVGYGTDNGVDYWKIKNSWGTQWGEDGYYRIARGSNFCGIASDVVHSRV